MDIKGESQNKIDCKFKFHSIHKTKKKSCFCIYEKPNYHYKRCPYFNKYRTELSNVEEKVKEVRKDIFQICCCDLGIEHDEVEKI